MLDFSKYLRQQGIVRFKRNAATYVPRESGIYRILAVPFSYSLRNGSATATYLRLFDKMRIDVRDQIAARFDNEDDAATIAIQGKLKYRKLESRVESKPLIELASLFPPLYIGKAVDLRSRFNDHTSGNNSHVLQDLDRHDLLRHLTFFHWHYCDKEDLDEVESILIQASLPVFNRQLS